MEINIFLEDGKIYNFQANQNITLGKILENTLRYDNKIIYDVNGIFFTVEGRRYYFGDDEFPFHFSMKRVIEEVGLINTFFLEYKNVENNLADILRNRYIIYLTNESDTWLNNNILYSSDSRTENLNGINIFSEIIRSPIIDESELNLTENIPSPELNYDQINLNDDNNLSDQNNEEFIDEENMDTQDENGNTGEEYIPELNNLVQHNNIPPTRRFEFSIHFNQTNIQNSFSPNQNDLPNENNSFNNLVNNHTIQNYLNTYISNITNIIREEFNFFENENRNEDVKIILKKEDFEKLPSGRFKDLKELYDLKINQCGITLEDFEDKSEIVILPCNHPFMKEEINKWLTENSNKCPICRKESGIGYPLL